MVNVIKLITIYIYKCHTNNFLGGSDEIELKHMKRKK